MAALRDKTCCFTGHRDIDPRETQRIEQSAETAVLCLYEKGVRFFGVGGAIGFDTMMAEMLFRLRETKLPDIKVILVYPFDGFTNRWSDAQKARYAALLPKYDKVVRVCEKPGRDPYLARDRHLVDGSAYCIAYCTRDTGGTAYTIRYAKQKGLDVQSIITM